MEIVLLILINLLVTGEIQREVRVMDAPEDCYNQMLLRKIEPLPQGVVDGRTFCIRASLDPLRGSKPI